MLLLTVLKIIAALFLLLGGIKYISTNLKRISGGALDRFLQKYTSTTPGAFTAGFLATAFLQSSSMVTVIVVGFINGGFLSLRQGLCIVIGSNLGTTITVQFFSLDTGFLIMPLLAAGVTVLSLEALFKKNYGGRVILGAAALIGGIELLSYSLKPLSDTPWFTELLSFGKDEPWKGVLTGAGAAVLIQSSSVTIGMVTLLVKEGALSVSEALGMVLGADIGTCITAILASTGTVLPARQVAWGHFIFNMMSLLLVVPAWKYFLMLLALTAGDFSQQVANAHFIYNLAGAAVALPVVDIYAYILQYIIRGTKRAF